jgi:hypothetical protein
MSMTTRRTLAARPSDPDPRGYWAGTPASSPEFGGSVPSTEANIVKKNLASKLVQLMTNSLKFNSLFSKSAPDFVNFRRFYDRKSLFSAPNRPSRDLRRSPAAKAPAA